MQFKKLEFVIMLLTHLSLALCYCFTSLKESKIPTGFEDHLSDLVSAILDKPKKVTFSLKVELFMKRKF